MEAYLFEIFIEPSSDRVELSNDFRGLVELGVGTPIFLHPLVHLFIKSQLKYKIHTLNIE
jgi:hypothetical protein